MFLFDSGDEVSHLVDGQLEILDNFVQSRRERLVIHVRENIIDATVFKEVLLLTCKERIL